jgi:hypothetical protein
LVDAARKKFEVNFTRRMNKGLPTELIPAGRRGSILHVPEGDVGRPVDAAILEFNDPAAASVLNEILDETEREDPLMRVLDMLDEATALDTLLSRYDGGQKVS